MHASCSLAVPRGSLAFVQDIDAAAAEAVGAQFGVPHTTDADEVFASADVDAVAICSSTDTHVPLLIGAARSRKAIFCEKPVSLDLVDRDRVLAIIAETHADPDRLQPALRPRARLGS